MEPSQHISKSTYRHVTCQHINMSTCKHDDMQTFHITINTAWLACLPLVLTTVAKILRAQVGFFTTLSFNLTGTLSKETASQPPRLSPSLSPSSSGLSCLGHLDFSEGQTFGEEFSTRVHCSKAPSVRDPHFQIFQGIEVPGLQELQIFTRIPRF